MNRDYELNNATDPTLFADDLGALWIFASALLNSALHGELAKLPGAEKIASACAAILPAIEKAGEEQS